MSSLRKPTESLLSTDWRADDQSQLEMALRRLSPEQQPKLAGKRWATDCWPAILAQMPDNYRHRFQMFKKQAILPKILAFYGAEMQIPLNPSNEIGIRCRNSQVCRARSSRKCRPV